MSTQGATGAYTAGMRQMWGGADYPGLARRLLPAAAALVEATLDPAGPVRVLDLAAGTGNVAALAAERGATVTAADLSPRMVELGRARTAGLDVTWHEADAEDLPFDDDAFDVALSAFGLIFAPRPDVALAQARRVVRPGGTLAFTSWTPAGFMGEMTTAMRRWLPLAPHGVADVLDWGHDTILRAWLAAAGFTDTTIATLTLPWHFDTPAAMTAFLLEHSPTHQAVAAGLGERADEMLAAVEHLAAAPGQPVRVEAEYLLVTTG